MVQPLKATPEAAATAIVEGDVEVAPAPSEGGSTPVGGEGASDNEGE